uniref:Uncharacterized protein n=1 Tax=Oryza sativa subsp. japonica TaxID=39947 RepID=Q5Z5K4_ORYSJ|nr:hypothetical protein [Oryza sativa Japonica Group]
MHHTCWYYWIFHILVLLKTYFANRPLKKLIPEIVLFRAPEWLAPSSNGTAPASLAPSSCHRGAREPTWQEEGASHAGAAPGRRAPAWLAPPPPFLLLCMELQRP